MCVHVIMRACRFSVFVYMCVCACVYVCACVCMCVQPANSETTTSEKESLLNSTSEHEEVGGGAERNP